MPPELRPNAYRDTWCGEVLPDRVGEQVRVAGWVHRRRDHGGLVFVDLRDRTGIVQVVFNPETAPEAHARSHELRSEWVISVRGRGRSPIRGDRQPRHADGRGRGARDGARGARAGGDARLPDRRGHGRRRGAAPAPPLPRPASRADAARARAAPPRHAGDPRPPERGGVPRHRDADPDALHARGRARLRGPGAHAARRLLRAAAVAAALQAAADDRGLRALLPDRPLLPRRGAARRPPARVHPARHGDGVRRRGGRDGGHRGRPGGGVRGRRRGAADAVPAPAPTTRRSPASAPTVPTCGSGWRSATSATPCAARSSRSSGACWRAAAWCAGSTPARTSCPARSSTG